MKLSPELQWKQHIAEEKANLQRINKFMGYSEDMENHLNKSQLTQMMIRTLNRLRYWEQLQSVYTTNYVNWDGHEVPLEESL